MLRPVTYYKIGLEKGIGGRWVARWYFGPFHIVVRGKSLSNVLEEVFEYDNTMNSYGPHLTGWPTNDRANTIILGIDGEWRAFLVAPVGWIELGDNPTPVDDEVEHTYSREDLLDIWRTVKTLFMDAVRRGRVLCSATRDVCRRMVAEYGNAPMPTDIV